METLLKVIALLSARLFAGAALYITAVEHPARISQETLIALQEFRPSYKRAAPLQAALAVSCFLCSQPTKTSMSISCGTAAVEAVRPAQAILAGGGCRIAGTHSHCQIYVPF